MYNQIISVWLIGEVIISPRLFSSRRVHLDCKNYLITLGWLWPKYSSSNLYKEKIFFPMPHQWVSQNSKWGFYCAFNKLQRYLFCCQMKSWIYIQCFMAVAAAFERENGWESEKDEDLILIPAMVGMRKSEFNCLFTKFMFFLFRCENYYHLQASLTQTILLCNLNVSK